jgi:putative aminopeptidase FrvX
MGNQGLDRLLNQIEPDEIIFVQRLESSHARPGDGVLVSAFERGEIALATELLAVARENQIPVRAEFPEAPPRGRYSGPLPLPARTALLGVPVLFPQTPAATASLYELSHLGELLGAYLGVTIPETDTALGRSIPFFTGRSPTETKLKRLSEIYGVSGYEEPVVEELYKLLPDWAKEWAFLDAAGNFIVPFGRPSEKPSLVFVAHMDEIGWVVDEIMADGRLRLRNRGGFLPEHFLGHAIYVHTADAKVPAVLELPPNYHAEPYTGRTGVVYTAYTGARTREDAEALGIRVGNSLTVPKQYRQLAGTRVNARSFDDRVGSVALQSALWEIDPKSIDREVIFVWAVREEIGLEGAKHFAARAAETGGVPDYVFAVDTFVSADSPLESPRYADGILGQGFVLRAVDHSNVTPRPIVDCVVQLANERNIPVQYGVTGGGNDGAAFVPYGSIDVPIGWSLRYSHSAAEVADLRDIEALADIVAALAQEGPECPAAKTGDR